MKNPILLKNALCMHFKSCLFSFLLLTSSLSMQARSIFFPAPADTLKNPKPVFFKSMLFGFPDRAANFEENLFRDAQLQFNLSVIHSNYDLSTYFTDEWLLQENDLQLITKPNQNDPLRKFRQTRLAAEVRGSFLFFYIGLGMVFPATYQKFSLGNGKSWYSSDSTRYFAEIRKGSFWKVGLNLHFRKWLIYGGIRGYQGLAQSAVLAENLKTGRTTALKGPGSDVFNFSVEFGLQFRNFTFGYESALNVDEPGAQCTSFSIGYNLFDFRNFNEKRIPR